MKEKTCCFTGHRFIPKDHIPILREKLKNTIVELVMNQDITYFRAGGALGFDTLAAQMILELKEKYTQIKLILVLPCTNQSEKWKRHDIEMYEYIKSKCDKCVYTSQEYYDGCMLERNRNLVDNSSYCICYLTNKRGGTFYTYNYAKEQGLTVINLASEI